MAKQQDTTSRFAVCVKTDGEDLLTLHKIYRVLPDESAARSNYIRVIDDEGEDYLYPADCFVFVDLPLEMVRNSAGNLDMGRTLVISDSLYERLESTTYAYGLSSIEQLLEKWQSSEDELRRRQEVVSQIDTLREHIFATYGEMPDSAELIREDRER